MKRQIKLCVNGVVLGDLSSNCLAKAIIEICSTNLDRRQVAMSIQKASSNKFVLFLEHIIQNVLRLRINSQTQRIKKTRLIRLNFGIIL